MAFDEWEWTGGESMDAPDNRTVQDIQRAGKSLTPLVSIDECPSPSPYEHSGETGRLTVRGWGILVLTGAGVRLLRRAELSSEVVTSFGPAWR